MSTAISSYRYYPLRSPHHQGANQLYPDIPVVSLRHRRLALAQAYTRYIARRHSRVPPHMDFLLPATPDHSFAIIYDTASVPAGLPLPQELREARARFLNGPPEQRHLSEERYYTTIIQLYHEFIAFTSPPVSASAPEPLPNITWPSAATLHALETTHHALVMVPASSAFEASFLQHILQSTMREARLRYLRDRVAALQNSVSRSTRDFWRLYRFMLRHPDI